MENKEEMLTEEVSFGRIIGIIARENIYYISKKIEKFDLKKNESKCLTIIYKEKLLCQDDLVTILKSDKYEVAKSIKSLIQKGYVYKERSGKDKRKYFVHPTQKALDIKDEYMNILKETTKILTTNFSDKEKEIAIELLKKMETNIYEEVKKIKNK